MSEVKWDQSNKRLRFTPRQMEILISLADGDTIQEIGKQMGITRRTVDAHLFHMRELLCAKTTTHLVALAFHEGILLTRRGNGRSV